MARIIELIGHLTHEALTELIEGRAIAIRVSNFAEDEVCEEIASRMLQSPLYGKYVNAPKIGKVGHAFFEVCHATVNEYFEKAVGWIQEIRKLCTPYGSPMDRLRLELDEVWPGSSQIARLTGRQMFAGLLRVFDEGAGAEPHMDVLDWDAAAVEIYEGAFLKCQMGANVYLKVPPVGGELVIWPFGLTRERYEQLRIEGSYGVQEHLLGDEAPTVIQPRQGELIIFNAGNVHAVRAPERGKRITWSSFIGYTSRSQPLTVWS